MNVIDLYQKWTNEAIMADLDTKRNNFTVLCCNWGYDFNVSSCIRSANAFLAKEVVIAGRKKFDRRGTVGTHKYTHLKHVKELENAVEYVENFNGIKIAIENNEFAKPIETFEWPIKDAVLMIFGQEDVGIPQEIIDVCDHNLFIKQYGSVRSLNVGVAAGIVMYDYCQKTIV